MTMRLGTADMFNTALANLQTRQTNLSNIQSELTSGLKIVNPSDDPTGAANAERAQTRLMQLATQQNNLQTHQDSVTLAEGTLGEITTALQSFRQLVVSAGSGTNTPADLATITTQLTGLRNQIMTLANTQDSNGLPVFGGLGSSTTPFTGSQGLPASYTFQGLPGQAASSINSIPGTLNGATTFMMQPARDGVYNVTGSAIPTGRTLTTGSVSVTNSAQVTGSAYNIDITGVDSTTVPGTTTITYGVTENPAVTVPPSAAQTVSYPTPTAGNTASFALTGLPGLSLTVNGTPAVGDQLNVTPVSSIFGVMDSTINDINGAANANGVTQAVAQSLGALDIGMNKVASSQGLAGTLMNQATAISNDQSNTNIQLKTDQSNAQDLNMVQGASEFQNDSTAYQAALQTYAQLQKLSLFDYIGGSSTG